jgi:hypothetical protein
MATFYLKIIILILYIKKKVCTMWLLKNYFFAFIVSGVLTRISFYFYRKNCNQVTSAYLSLISVGIFLIPIMSYIIGFDIAVAEYLSSLLIWLIYDLLRKNAKKEKKK